MILLQASPTRPLSYAQERLHLEDQEFSSYQSHLARGELLQGLFSTGLFYQSTEKTGGWINYSSFNFEEILSRGSPTYRPLLQGPSHRATKETTVTSPNEASLPRPLLLDLQQVILLGGLYRQASPTRPLLSTGEMGSSKE